MFHRIRQERTRAAGNRSPAAVFGEIGEQSTDFGHRRPVALVAPFPLDGHQSGVLQALEMERNGVVGLAKASGNVSRDQTLRFLFDQQPENPQPMGRRKGLKTGGHPQQFHVFHPAHSGDRSGPSLSITFQ